MAASQFIALLESRGLLDPEIITELHRQVEQSKGRVTPEAIAKLLVENGQLTRFQATKLVTELNQSLASARPDPSAALRGGRPIVEPVIVENDSVEDLLPQEVVEVNDVVEEVQVVAEAVEVVEVKTKRSKRKRVKEVIEAPDLRDLAPVVVREPMVKKKSAWESFRIVGYGFLVLLLLILLVPLVQWFLKGSADDAYGNAETAYKSQDYERASKSFADFALNFKGDDRASQSRVFAALAKVRQSAEKAADPTVALKTCQEVLPSIVSESSMGALRGDVTDTLLRIAEKFVVKAENTTTITDRKSLIDKMNQQLEFIRDPRFVGSQERTQNELRIRKIEEDQSRLLREIQRSEELETTLIAMTASVEAKNVAETYELRRKLLRKYPQLESEPKLAELLAAATGQQQNLIVAAPTQPVVSTDPTPAAIGMKAVLVGRKTVNENATGPTFFLRVKGSVVAMNSANGQIVWRQFIGRDWSGDAKPIASTADSDVLVFLPELGQLRRLASADGTLIWQTQFKGRIVEPSIDGDEIFVNTVDGEAYCIDAATGQTRWGKKLPQGIEVGTGGATGKKKRYVLGNHSNLYVLSRASGQCEEVMYVGHGPASISVPPIWILNQLILFETDGPDASLMRVFTTNDDGLQIQAGQKPVRLRGHVVVPPQVDGRRLAVVTNLGEVAILDVDKANPKEKVTKLVNSIENETIPKLTWPLMVGNDLWLASTRLCFYQVQVSSQKLNRLWLKEDSDQFTCRPIKLDDMLIHARIVRGNLGVRVAAMNPSSGDILWESDVGVPVTSLSTDGKGFTAITAQTAAFSIDSKTLALNQAISPIENLGRNQRSMMFLSPIPLKDSRIAILNQAQGSQMLLVDPAKRTENPTKIFTMSWGETFPANEAVVVSSGALVVPMDNAQIVLMDPEKGKMIGTPFQPTIQPGERPKWLNPVVLADKQSVVIADQQRYMYKLTTGKQLRSITSQPLERALKGRLSVIADTIVGVSSGASGDQLEFFDGNELMGFQTVQVEGRFVWGPYAVVSATSSAVVGLSDIDGLVACDASGKRIWTVPLNKTVLVGAPVPVESDCILASTTGELIRISIADGTIVARMQTGEPISGPPLVLPKGLLVPCDEGVVLTVPMLTANTDNVGAGQ